MANVFMSFLGLGGYNEETGKWGYKKTTYELNETKSGETEFVQVAEIEILGAADFDKILIIATEKSYDTHFEGLEKQLTTLGARNIYPLIISEDMSAEGQWKWFEKILSYIEHGDEITIDMTHGYRSSSIVLSTSINFLQKARDIKLMAVYYGAFDKNRKLAPIIDMKDFYMINEWADAVSRLVEDADAKKMAKTAQETSDFQIGELNDKVIINAFEDLTNTIRNVDINNIAEKANTAIDLINKKKKGASVTGRILLDLVLDKFTAISTEEPLNGKYDKNYFMLQLEIIKLLMNHKLFMQAYTVMREFIGSIGLIEVEKADTKTSKGRKQRKKADVFVNMIQIDKNDWNFKGTNLQFNKKLKPYYEHLKIIGAEPILREFTKDLIEYRNGFDHAWTLKKEAYDDIEEKGIVFYNKLKKVIVLLEKSKIIL